MGGSHSITWLCGLAWLLPLWGKDVAKAKAVTTVHWLAITTGSGMDTWTDSGQTQVA